MGLDNIPRQYPCEEKAIREEGRIDCVATQNAGFCTWKNEYESNPLVNDTRPAIGIFGTDCWYRGKYGNWLLSVLEDQDDAYHTTKEGYSFYGNGDGEEEGISPDECLEMSKWMADNTELFAFQARKNHPDRAQEITKDWIYASWWLKFVGEKCDGSQVWY